ncbi:MAG: flagellar protein export ATPase FliI [Burkholderiales bacterium]
MTTHTELLVGPLRQYLARCEEHVRAAAAHKIRGRLVRVAGLVMEATGLSLPVGSTCLVIQEGGQQAEADVVGFSGERLFLMPSSDIRGLRPGALVMPLEATSLAPRFGDNSHPWRRAEDRTRRLPVGPALLGRVIDGAGSPLDQLGAIRFEQTIPLSSRPVNPIDREPIEQVLDVGVRPINALLTVGRGQRMGLFAGSGVGKSVLLGMMARYTSAEIIVVGLIGERGREVKEFIEQILGKSGLARSVVIAAPADTPPLMRLQGAIYAAAVAEYFRDAGKHVLLIMDSLTRFAMAQREIALAIGEPPATKGYPPSVFARLPQLVERAGNGVAGRGSITAFYTVLTEGDDQQDPIADAARAILDGHIVLSRDLAEQGHYPAIDVEQSISRVMHSISSPEHLRAARRMKQLYSRMQKARDLISVGAYVAGGDPVLDQAIALRPRMDVLLQQDLGEKADFASSRAALLDLLAADQTSTT